MNIRRFLVRLLLVFSFLASVHSEADGGRVLPRFRSLSMKNIYIEANGGISMPVTFLGIKTSSVTNMGFNYTGGLGINWDGYLVGFEYSHNMWGAGANEFMLIDDLNSDIIAFWVEFSKIKDSPNNKRFLFLSQNIS